MVLLLNLIEASLPTMRAISMSMMILLQSQKQKLDQWKIKSRNWLETTMCAYSWRETERCQDVGSQTMSSRFLSSTGLKS